MKPVRALAVADSSSLAALRRLLQSEAIDIVYTASTATGSLSLLRHLSPDVVLLDLDMSQTDVAALLAQLAHERGAPVVALASRATSTTLRDLALVTGAACVVERPSARAAVLRVCGRRTEAPPAYRSSLSSGAPSRHLIVIGASTGGTSALSEVLKDLPANATPVLVVQHMLAEFTRDFAERLNAACAMHVCQASDGACVTRGNVLIAPGGFHLRLGRDPEGGLRAVVSNDAPIGKHRPSVDALFLSCAEVLGAAAVGVLLTGMGDDGARGLLAMHRVGARTIVQDQASSVCGGMPSAAIKCGAAQQVLPLPDIARALLELQPIGRRSLPARD